MAGSARQPPGTALRVLAQRIWDSARYRTGLLAEAILPELALDVTAALMRHRASVGVFPNLVKPSSFNEKVLHRIVFDRRPILVRMQDKYAVRGYVAERVGDDILPRLYWVTRTPADIPFDDLPARFVVKPTHGSGWYALVSDKAQIDRRELLERCNGWLSQNYYRGEREHVYKHIEPRILVEEYVDDGSGPYPTRYKLYVFHGRTRAIYAGIGSPGRSASAFYGRSWERLPACFATEGEIEGNLIRPRHLDQMIAYAEALANGLDFIRVDLYDTATKPYFGELTTTPGGGAYRFRPPEFDHFLGRFWHLYGKAPAD